MNKDIIINGILHNCFTQSNYVPDDAARMCFSEHFNARHYFIAAFSLLAANSSAGMHAQFISSIPQYAAELADFPIWYYRTEDNIHLLLLNHNNIDEIFKFIENVHKYFMERYDFINYWGISRACSSVSELLFAKKEAITALDIVKQSDTKHILQYEPSIRFSTNSRTEYFYPNTAKQLLIYAVKNMDYALLDFILTILYDENIRLPQSQESLLQLNFCIVNTLQSFHNEKQPISEKLLSFSQNSVLFQTTPEQYFHELLGLCKYISEQINLHKNNHKTEMISDIQYYIRQNYSNANLNLSSISEHFERSEGYLSSLFKETAGISFSEYLEKCRIDKSCELLLTSDESIATIAQLSGYSNVYSFRRAFKRILNLSPKDYRNKNISEQMINTAKKLI